MRDARGKLHAISNTVFLHTRSSENALRSSMNTVKALCKILETSFGSQSALRATAPGGGDPLSAMRGGGGDDADAQDGDTGIEGDEDGDGQSSKLTTLDLVEQAGVAAERASKAPPLLLDLQDCAVGDAGVDHLAGVLRDIAIAAAATIKCTGIDRKVLRGLKAATPEERRTLQLGNARFMPPLNIDLSHNNIGDEGVKELCRALVANRSIRRVDLCGNHISAVGLRMITHALRYNTGITSVDLSGNHLSDGDLVACLHEGPHSESGRPGLLPTLTLTADSGALPPQHQRPQQQQQQRGRGRGRGRRRQRSNSCPGRPTTDMEAATAVAEAAMAMRGRGHGYRGTAAARAAGGGCGNGGGGELASDDVYHVLRRFPPKAEAVVAMSRIVLNTISNITSHNPLRQTQERPISAKEARQMRHHIPAIPAIAGTTAPAGKREVAGKTRKAGAPRPQTATARLGGSGQQQQTGGGWAAGAASGAAEQTPTTSASLASIIAASRKASAPLHTVGEFQDGGVPINPHAGGGTGKGKSKGKSRRRPKSSLGIRRRMGLPSSSSEGAPRVSAEDRNDAMLHDLARLQSMITDGYGERGVGDRSGSGHSRRTPSRRPQSAASHLRSSGGTKKGGGKRVIRSASLSAQRRRKKEQRAPLHDLSGDPLADQQRPMEGGQMVVRRHPNSQGGGAGEQLAGGAVRRGEGAPIGRPSTAPTVGRGGDGGEHGHEGPSLLGQRHGGRGAAAEGVENQLQNRLENQLDPQLEEKGQHRRSKQRMVHETATLGQRDDGQRDLNKLQRIMAVFAHCRADRYTDVEATLEEGCPVDVREPGTGNTMLMVAVAAGRNTVVKVRSRTSWYLKLACSIIPSRRNKQGVCVCVCVCVCVGLPRPRLSVSH